MTMPHLRIGPPGDGECLSQNGMSRGKEGCGCAPGCYARKRKDLTQRARRPQRARRREKLEEKGAVRRYGGGWENSGGGALSMEIHDLAGDFLDVGDAAEAYGGLGDGIVRAGLGGGADDDVAAAVGTFAVIHGNDVGRSAGLHRTGATAADDHDALIGDGVDGGSPAQVSPQRGQNDPQADEQERHSKQGEKAERAGEGVAGFVHGMSAVVGGVDPESGEASEWNAEQGGRKRGQGGPGGIGNARPIEALTGLQLRLGAEFGVAGIHGGPSLAVARETLSILAARGRAAYWRFGTK